MAAPPVPLNSRCVTGAAFLFKLAFMRKKSKGLNSPKRLALFLGTAATRRHVVSCTERNEATHTHGIEVASIPIVTSGLLGQ